MNRDLRLKIARQIAGFTQQSLAMAAGCRESLIARVETGRAKPDRETAERIAQIVGKRPFEVGL